MTFSPAVLHVCKSKMENAQLSDAVQYRLEKRARQNLLLFGNDTEQSTGNDALIYLEMKDLVFGDYYELIPGETYKPQQATVTSPQPSSTELKKKLSENIILQGVAPQSKEEAKPKASGIFGMFNSQSELSTEQAKAQREYVLMRKRSIKGISPNTSPATPIAEQQQDKAMWSALNEKVKSFERHQPNKIVHLVSVCSKVSLKFGSLEPLFYRVFLYDMKYQKRISEEFALGIIEESTFASVNKGVLRKIHDALARHVLKDPTAMFSIQEPHIGIKYVDYCYFLHFKACICN